MVKARRIHTIPKKCLEILTFLESYLFEVGKYLEWNKTDFLKNHRNSSNRFRDICRSLQSGGGDHVDAVHENGGRQIARHHLQTVKVPMDAFVVGGRRRQINKRHRRLR